MNKEILDFLGIQEDDAKDLKGFSSKFSELFIRKQNLNDSKSPEYKEIAPSIIGKVAGNAQTVITRKLKEAGVDISKNDFKDKMIEEVVEFAFDQLSGAYGTKIKDLEKAAAAGGDQALTDLKEKYESLQKKNQDTESALSTLKSALSEKEKNFASELKGFKLKSAKRDLFGSAQYAEGIQDVAKIGFQTHIENNFSLDLDENESLVLLTKEGHRIPNPKKAGEFLSPLDIMKEEGLKLGVWAANPHEKEKKKPFEAKNNFGNQGHQGAFPAGGNTRKISSAIKQ
ncbi:MAG: hypothetical protein DWQ44_08985 [Bacteroidetes bacterium]|nr:MAG: hypothetical protein DWQ33_02790 [Bacteroidota bacterium]REK06424.1 MAG: hypothetical protein DWQ39_02775 [Bacteroidota bacterium]REK33190.1 MAG: hypothetical protein DWQ44_08985 [Bacteroidota bacterium]REK47026.1 MAG: hypothetical protein DWQ48_13315 [Bacteroidota bacterium]